MYKNWALKFLILLLFVLICAATCNLGLVGATDGEELLGEFVAGDCGNLVIVTNNQSIYENTAVELRSESGTVEIGDVESEPGKKSQGNVPIDWAGLTVSVFVVPGPDGKHSLSWADVAVECPTPSPSPTVPPPSPSPSPSPTPSASPTATDTPTATLTPTTTVTPSPSPTGTWQPTATPESTDVPTREMVASPTPTAVPAADFVAPRSGGGEKLPLLAWIMIFNVGGGVILLIFGLPIALLLRRRRRNRNK